MIRLLKFAASAIVIALISVALAEIALRVLFDKYDPDKDLVFITQPGGYRLGEAGTNSRHWKNTGDFDVQVRINDHRFRDSKDVDEALHGDWFVVGDSYAFGFGVDVESRFSNRLEQLTGRPFYNIAIPNDLDGYRRLVDHARAGGADISRLIVSICMENDIYSYPDPSFARAPDQELPMSASAWRIGYLKARRSDSSALYKAGSMLIHQAPLLREAAVKLGLIRENLAGVPATRYSDAAVRRSADRAEALATLPGIEGALFVIVPSRGLWVDGHREEHDKIHDGFVRALAAKGLNVLDLRTEFEAGGDPLSYHFRQDGHWNEAGHDLAARTIAGRLDGM